MVPQQPVLTETLRFFILLEAFVQQSVELVSFILIAKERKE
jgi:hypothetical protein